jgi:hypothetical protein
MVSTPPYKSKFTREQVQAELNRFYYDTAQVSLVGTLAALAKLVPVSQIVYVTSTRFFATRFFQMPEDVVGIGGGKKTPRISRCHPLEL